MVFTEEQKLLRQSVREFCEKEVAPLVPDMVRTNIFPKGIIEKIGEMGFLRVAVPESVGGLGLGQVELNIVMEEIARVSPALALSCELSMVGAPNILMCKGATDKYMEKVMSGEYTICGIGTQPKGNPQNAVEWDVSLTRDEDGVGYRLNQTNICITNEADAGMMYVYCKDDKGELYNVFIEGDWEGVERFEPDMKLGQAGTGGGTVRFNNVYIPPENVAPAAAGAEDGLYRVLNACAAEALGCMKGIFEKTVEFCKTRTHNRLPMTTERAIAYKLAYLKTLIDTADALTYSAAVLRDELDPFDGTGDEDDVLAWHLRASASKVRVSEIGVEVCDECIKLHGGLGYHDPTFHHWLGDSVNYCMMDWNNEMHLENIAYKMKLQG